MYAALAWVSETIHYRRYGYRMHLCARAYWRKEWYWRLWRVVFDRLLRRRDRRGHCEACVWRSME